MLFYSVTFSFFVNLRGRKTPVLPHRPHGTGDRRFLIGEPSAGELHYLPNCGTISKTFKLLLEVRSEIPLSGRSCLTAVLQRLVSGPGALTGDLTQRGTRRPEQRVDSSASPQLWLQHSLWY